MSAFKFEEIAQLLDYDNKKLTPLEKKNIDIAECMDFSIYFFDDKNGDRFYCLYDEQREMFYSFIDEDMDIRESEYVTQNLSEILNIIPENYFEDYGFDVNKVFDIRIDDINGCYQSTMDNFDNLDSKEQFNVLVMEMKNLLENKELLNDLKEDFKENPKRIEDLKNNLELIDSIQNSNYSENTIKRR